MDVLLFFIFAVITVFVLSFLFAAFRRLNRWNRTYDRLSKRYGGSQGKGGVVYGFGLTKPSLTFDYGRTFCALRNRKSFRFAAGKQTEFSMVWPNRKLKLEISTSPARKTRGWGGGAMKQVFIEEPEFQSNYYVSSNKPFITQKMLTTGVQWQIEQLRRHMGNEEIQITLNRGSLVVSKPGYIKEHTALEDFVRFSLELFDQLMLFDAEGIEFVNEDQASVVDDVKCPICSEEIMNNMVVCARCKTPHCQDCWHYNGQCATFACSETRCIYSGVTMS
jgi:hypothetical protein